MNKIFRLYNQNKRSILDYNNSNSIGNNRITSIE